MSDREVPLPELVVDPQATAEVRAVAEAYLPHFLNGRRAPDHLYAWPVSTWHAATDTRTIIDAPPSQARLREVLPDLHHEDVAVHVHARGFVVQATVVATVDGEVRRLPTVVVVHVADGRITGFDEYADSVTAGPFREALTN
jgi:ketosteroid isomerase-like protein